MTSNQRRAVRIAERLALGELRPVELTEADWTLLLLAGGANEVWSGTPVRLARRVLNQARDGTGYFCEPGHPRARGAANSPAAGLRIDGVEPRGAQCPTRSACYGNMNWHAGRPARRQWCG